MDILAYETYLREMNMTEVDILEAKEHIRDYLTYLTTQGKAELITLIKAYLKELIKNGQNTYKRIRNLGYYYRFIDEKEIYIFFTSVLGGAGVIEAIEERLTSIAGVQLSEQILKEIEPPPLGTTIDDMPFFTKAFMEILGEYLDEHTCHRVLAGNNHNIPREAFNNDIRLYQSCENIDVFLKKHHQEKVLELQEHCDKKKLWYEQIITQPVVDYVRSNQEILSGVRHGDTLYVTKIPYDTVGFLESKDAMDKRFHACHCSFAKASIKTRENVGYKWCYCSAGFAKYPYEVIFGEELDVEVLQSPLKGDLICRFAIKLPKSVLENLDL